MDDGSGRYWDYERGWVSADGTVDDDTVSVLTKNTLEQNSPVIPESPQQHLQSVAEEDSNSEEESAVQPRGLTTRNAVAAKSTSQEEKSDIELPSLINNYSDNSDKENGESVKDGEDASKASTS